jgi:hypothetical protein
MAQIPTATSQKSSWTKPSFGGITYLSAHNAPKEPSNMQNFVHHEGYGFHLSVSPEGVVSLWDTENVARQAHSEDVYVWLDLTERQRKLIEAAVEKAGGEQNA